MLEISEHLVAEVTRIARQAGGAILGVYAQWCSDSACESEIVLAAKSDTSPLTRADLLAHQLIVKGLTELSPETFLVSEEDPHSHQLRCEHGDFWLIDPLDGTKEFLARNGEFTVNIALIRNGEAILGVVFAPVLGQLYSGALGLGAYVSTNQGRQRIQVAPKNKPGRVLKVLASKSHLSQETSEFIQRLGPHELVQAGSSLKFCRVAEGAADIYPRLAPTAEWDTAAAQAIVEAAGGHVLRLDGQPLRYGKPEVLNPHFIAANVAFAEYLNLA